MPDPTLFDQLDAGIVPAAREVAHPHTDRAPGSAATLRRARVWLQERLSDGVRCPCCGQYSRVYRRRITSTSARALVELYRAGGTAEFVHLPTVLGRKQADECKMAYWGLIEERPKSKRRDGGRAGWWRVTELGERWLYGHATVPKYALVYDGSCLGLEGEQVTISEALAVDFDLSELLAS